ncbi:MAG: InlB B-repeat-containing protein [Chitinispirillales bacterium]|nr:InlB B-repeat-containing protein [Chitinispirillales bacterium]
MLKRFSFLVILLSAALLPLFIVTCGGDGNGGSDDIGVYASVADATNITTNSAYITVQYGASGAKIQEIGVVYSTTAGRLSADNIMAFDGTPKADFGVISGTPSVSGEFGGDLLGLSGGTAYFYKPFVRLDRSTNEFREGYFVPSELKVFTTLESPMHTVTLEANGGVVSPRTVSIETGKTIGDIAVIPTRTGHAFTGWYPTETGGQRYPETYVITEDLTLYAQWTSAAYTITLNPNGGIVAPTSINAPAEATLEQLLLPTPTRAGHTFEGWYSAETGGSKYPETFVITEDLTLHAQWTAAAHTITLNPNGGIVSPTNINAPAGATLGQLSLPMPSRAGFAFDGWYSAETGGARYTETFVITENMTLHAQWTAAAYTITLNPNGGIVSPTSIPAPAGATLGQLFLPTPTRADHTFDGWYSAATGGERYPEAYVIVSDLTLYARWEAISIHTITLNPNGGIVSPTSVTALAGAMLEEISVPTPTRANHTFDGWYSAATGGSQYPETHVITADFTMYAQWTLSTYNITLNPNGGIVSPTTLTATAGTALGQINIPTPTRANHTFDGWYSAETGGTRYPETFAVNEDIALHAQWIAVTHTLTLNPNGGIVSPTSVTVEAGKTIGELGLPFPTLDNHTFNGWFTTATGGTRYENAFAVMGNLTLHAQWTPISISRIITLNPNGGTVTPTSVIVEDGTALNEITIPTPVMANHRFDGWFTAATGGTRYRDDYVVRENLTLYAQWKRTAFTDARDNQVYGIVEVNGKMWMSENLRFVPADVNASTCYSGLEALCGQSGTGRLYCGIYVGSNAQVCPVGWRLPTNSEYTEFAAFVTLNGAESVNMQYGGYCRTLACTGTTNEGDSRRPILVPNMMEYGETAYFWTQMDAFGEIIVNSVPLYSACWPAQPNRAECPEYSITRMVGDCKFISINNAGSISQGTSEFSQIIQAQLTGRNYLRDCLPNGIRPRACSSPVIGTGILTPYRSIRCVQED